MRVVVYGAGGVGGSIGAGLHRSGQEVLLIARGAHGAAMQSGGLRLVRPEGTEILRIPVVTSPGEVAWRADDVVLLTMKSQHTQAALMELKTAHPDALVVCAQNGVANERMAASVFRRVMGMVVNLPAMHLVPGEVITHAVGKGGILDCGLYPEGVDAVVESLAAGLEKAGFSARPDAHVMRWKYAKLLTNLINTAQALIGDVPALAVVTRAARREALACYQACGIQCASPEEVKARHRDTYRMGDIPGMPRSGGSTWQSLARGTGNVESDFLNGEIVLLGQQAGIDTPINSGLLEIMHEAMTAGVAAGGYDAQRLLDRLGLTAS
jgi:2-dehydropantoate 2-reductase